MKATDLNMIIQKSVDVKTLEQNQQNAVAVQQQAQTDEANKTALRQADRVWQSNPKAKREAIDNEEKSEEEKREKDQTAPQQAHSRKQRAEKPDPDSEIGNNIDVKA